MLARIYNEFSDTGNVKTVPAFTKHAVVNRIVNRSDLIPQKLANYHSIHDVNLAQKHKHSRSTLLAKVGSKRHRLICLHCAAWRRPTGPHTFGQGMLPSEGSVRCARQFPFPLGEGIPRNGT